ncbi:hypothetical protein P2318_09640 [Myxococcaceae bacterium GXIMD 01537]
MGFARGWWCVLGALLLACGPMPETMEAAPPEEAAQALGLAPPSLQDASWRGGLVGPEFPVNAPVLRLLETRVGGPAVAFDGEQYLVVWADDRRGTEVNPFGNISIFGARVKKDGTVLDPAGFLIAEPRPEAEERIGLSSPSVAFDGKRFLVMWQGQEDSRGAFFSRVTRDGKSLDPQGIRLPSFFGGAGFQSPSVACDGAGLCLAVRTNDNEETGSDRLRLLGGVLLRNGAVVGPGTEPFLIAAPPAVPRRASVAWSGREFLVVWEDVRAGGITETDIFAARVRKDGTVVDPNGFPVTTNPGEQRDPDVAWTGKHFLVVWEERASDEALFNVTAARVTSAATVLDPGGFPVSAANGEQREPRVAAGGGTTLVVWTDTRTGRPRIRATRVKDDDVLDGTGFAVSRSLFFQDTPDVAFGGGRFLVPFGAAREGTGERTVLASRVETDGDVLDDSAIRVLTGAPAQHTPAAAFGGGNYLVAWQDDRDDAGSHIRAARVRPDGDVIEENGIRLPSGPGAVVPAVASDGRDFLVVWVEPGAGVDLIRGTRVSSTGRVLDSGGILIATAGPSSVFLRSVKVAFGGGRYLVVWTNVNTDTPADRFDVRAARVRTDGTVLDPGGFLVSNPDGGQLSPAVAFVSGRFLVVYQESISNFPAPPLVQLLLTRVTTDGAVLDPDGIFLADDGNDPAIASAGTQALVAWTRTTSFPLVELLAARVTGDGTVLDPGGFFLPATPPAPTLPAVTFNGSRYWVAWEEVGRNPNAVDIFGARVRTDGEVLDPRGVPISTVPFTESYSPALASDGRGDSAVFYSRFARGRDLNNFRVKGRLLDR